MGRLTSRVDDPRVAALVRFFEGMRPDALDELATIYRADASFKDPFNELAGLAAVRAVYAHMFDKLVDPRFVVVDVVAQGRQVFLTWDFHFSYRTWRRNEAQRIHGATHLVLDEDGLIAVHRDYWDAAEELYAKLPVVGGLVRWLGSLGRIERSGS